MKVRIFKEGREQVRLLIEPDRGSGLRKVETGVMAKSEIAGVLLPIAEANQEIREARKEARRLSLRP